MDKRYSGWDVQKRINGAAWRHLREGESQTSAARRFGVSRKAVNQRVSKIRPEYEAEIAGAERKLAERILAQAKSPAGLRERRRVGTFWEFDERFFGHWICPDCQVHHPTPKFHEEIIDLLEDDETKRGLVNVGPYHSKSTLVSVKHTVYRIAQNPNWRRIIVSKTAALGQAFLGQIADLLTNPDMYEGAQGNLVEEWGPFKVDGQGWNQNQIYVGGRTSAEKDPTVRVLGVEAQIYGFRADDIVFDDIADTENSMNPARVARMLEWVDKMALSRIGRNSSAYFVGTRVNNGDIYSFLKQRSTYKVLSWPCIIDESNGETLWPDHFPIEAALVRREEMRPADWQLIYQNLDVPGLGASFTEDDLEKCKNRTRTFGMFDSRWRLVAGLDLAGGNKDSGYTACVVKGVDLDTAKRFYVDMFNEKAMKAPRLKDALLDLADAYPLYELRVESNALQSQIIQYDLELVRELATRGVRVVPHITGRNKWDPEFGVESTAPLFIAELEDIPWGNAPTARKFQQLIEQLIVFPMGQVTDVVMADWFAELAIRDILKRAHLPLFNERMRVPDRIRRGRRIVDFGQQEIRNVPLHEQQGSARHGLGVSNFRRRTLGSPFRRGNEPAPERRDIREFVNVEGEVDVTDA